MANQVLTDIYGRGWAFPPQFLLENSSSFHNGAGVKMAEGDEDVRQSLKVLFLTEPGERIMRESYGCGLYRYMFENISDDLIANIQNQIQESILRYEPRANVINIDVHRAINSFNRLQVKVTYRLSGSEISQQLEGILDVGEGRTLGVL